MLFDDPFCRVTEMSAWPDEKKGTERFAVIFPEVAKAWGPLAAFPMLNAAAILDK